MRYIDIVFEILEMEPTKNQHKIKKAYAKLVKIYHPEDHPDEWQRIHNAYQLAMQYAKEPSADMIAEETKTQEAPQQYNTAQEQIDFLDIINRGHDKKQEAYKKDLEEVVSLLDKICEDTEEQQWEQVLDNPSFYRALLDEELLKNLKKALNKSDITQYIRQRITKMLEAVLIQADEESDKLQLYQVRQSAIRSHQRYLEKHPTKEMIKERKKKRFSQNAGRYAMLVIPALVIILLLAGKNNKTANDRPIIPPSVAESFSSTVPLKDATDASEKIAEYLNQKYDGSQYDAEMIQSDLQKDSLALYQYKRYIADIEGKGTVWIVYEDNEHWVCFDDYQKEEIQQAMKEQLLEQTGFEDCFFLDLNIKQNDDFRLQRWWTNKPGYIQRFDGDLKLFFEQEMAAVIAAAADDNTTPKHVNGGLAVYFPDPGAATITERIQQKPPDYLEQYREALDETEKSYNLMIRSCIMPQDYYAFIKESGEAIKHTTNSFYQSHPRKTYETMPYYSLAVTASYANNLTAANELVSLADGVYTIKAEGDRQEPVLKEEKLSDAAAQYIEENIYGDCATFSFSLENQGEKTDALLLLDTSEFTFQGKELDILIPDDDTFKFESLVSIDQCINESSINSSLKLDKRYIVLNYSFDKNDSAARVYTLFWEEEGR